MNEELEKEALQLYPDSQQLYQIYNARYNELRREGFIAGANSNFIKRQIIEAQIETVYKLCSGVYTEKELLADYEKQFKELDL